MKINKVNSKSTKKQLELEITALISIDLSPQLPVNNPACLYHGYARLALCGARIGDFMEQNTAITGTHKIPAQLSTASHAYNKSSFEMQYINQSMHSPYSLLKSSSLGYQKY